MLLADNPEPTSAEEVAAWVALANRGHDPFADVFAASEAHREAHDARECTVYPSSNGPLLGLLASATRAGRILEVGTGLGYSALWLARGAGANATVDTCEADAAHAELAREQIAHHAGAAQIKVHVGAALETIAGFEAAYEMIFLDANLEEYPALFGEFMRLLAPGGLLISSNLFLGVHVPDDPTLVFGARYREMLIEATELATTFLSTGLALSLRRT